MSAALAKLDRTSRSRPRRVRLHEQRGYKRRLMEDEATNRTLDGIIAALAEARARAGLSQVEVDARIDSARGTCCRWENGLVRMSLYNALRYAKAIGLGLAFVPPETADA